MSGTSNPCHDREWLLTPGPRFTNLEELNSWLADQCLAIGRNRFHPEKKDLTIRECFIQEQQYLIPFTAPFDGYAEKKWWVTRTSLVNYNRNKYSVSSKVAGRTATTRVTADLVQMIKDGALGEHVR